MGTSYADLAVCCDGERSLDFFIYYIRCNFRVQRLIIIVKSCNLSELERRKVCHSAVVIKLNPE